MRFRHGRAITQDDAHGGNVGVEIGVEFVDLHACIYRRMKSGASASWKMSFQRTCERDVTGRSIT